jgi:hypothetical protein
MIELHFSFFSITITELLQSLIVLPVAIYLFWRLYHYSGRDAIRFSGLEYSINAGLNLAGKKYFNRQLLVIILLLFLCLAWTSPEIRTSRPLYFGPVQELNPVYLVALDVSGSMTEPLGGYVIDGELNLGGPNRFEASRAELFGFAERNPSANLGLILFSVQPMLVRWPTAQTEFDFKDVLDEGMRFTNPARIRTSQLAQFAGGTATRAGLAMARDTLSKQKASTKSIILIGDLIDNIDEVIDGIQQIEKDEIFVYVIAIDSLPESLTAFTSHFSDSENVKTYPVNSEIALGSAFIEIERIESERRVSRGNLNFVQNIRWLIALLGFVIATVTIISFETRLHKTHS